MVQLVTDARQFRADKAWGARTRAEIDGATERLHWTDARYVWHRNDGPEVFCVIADAGDEHVAHPIGEARILVIERKGSV